MWLLLPFANVVQSKKPTDRFRAQLLTELPAIAVTQIGVPTPFISVGAV